ncbi:replication stress response regulator SDE2 [Morus notabilis]|nr:replication stress response regulator SDE2 [Morus notabilis]
MEITTNSTEPKIYQLMVTLLERKTLILRYATPNVLANDIKHRLYEITRIPTSLQRLITGTSQLRDDSVISSDGGHFPAVFLTLRLRGGKGGFGSLLRGAGSKAWQKKTSNFDACRDMSGRRLRHVNAEKKLEEWKAAEEERRLEKKAEEFLKKLAKKGKKGVGDGVAEKYVAKYREESERCVSEVLDSVKEAVEGKRKAGSASNVAEAKRLKIWMGKRTLAESDGDDSDEEQENEKSTILNNGNHSDYSKDAEGSSGSVTGGKQDGELSNGSSESGSEEEKENVVLGSKDCCELPIQDSLLEEQSDVSEPLAHGEKIAQATTVPCSDEVVQEEKMNCDETVVENVSTSSCRDGVESTVLVSDSPSSESGLGVHEEADSSKNVAETETETPLDFDRFNSAVELEVLGLERLKSELQARGLKCGGTLQERAARLFLLKSTPLDKIPKKLLAKK